MSEIDRDAFLELLGTLQSDSADDVLATARAIKAQMAEADVTWDMLLVQAPGDDDAHDDDEDDEDAGETATANLTSSPDEIVALIEELLTKHEISDDTREELNEYKEDLAEGEFGDSDDRYLRALYRRVTGKKR